MLTPFPWLMVGSTFRVYLGSIFNFPTKWSDHTFTQACLNVSLYCIYSENCMEERCKKYGAMHNRMVREEDGCNIVICMQFTIKRFLQASSLSGHVCECDKCTLCDTVMKVSCVSRGRENSCSNATRGRGVSQATRMSWPISVPSFQGILAHFTFLHFASFASFRSPLPLSGPALCSPCGIRVLLTYSSPLGFEKFSLFWHSWDHFSRRVNEWQSSGILSRVQDHQEIQEMPGVVPGEGRGTNILVVSLASQR